MFGKAKDLFSIVGKVLATFAFVATLIEIDYEEVEDSSDLKEKEALKTLEKALDKLVEEESIPQWAKDVFFNEFLAKYALMILVKVAHKINFFIKGDN